MFLARSHQWREIWADSSSQSSMLSEYHDSLLIIPHMLPDRSLTPHTHTHTHHKFCIQSNLSDLRQPKNFDYLKPFKSPDVSALFLLLKSRRKQQSRITAKHTSRYSILNAFLQYFPKML